MKLLSSGGGAIKSRQEGFYSCWGQSSIAIVHNAVDVERSELRLWASNSDNRAVMIGEYSQFKPHDLARTATGFSHAVTSTNYVDGSGFDSTITARSPSIASVYWELIEYA